MHVVTGGTRRNTARPTVVADVDPSMRVSCDEIFGPAIAVSQFDDIDRAIAVANDTTKV